MATPPKSDIQKAATRAAKRVDASVGLDPLSLITILTTLLPSLLQLFQSCKQPSPTPPSPQHFLASNYDPATGQFSRRLYVAARPRTRKEARANGKTRLRISELDAISHAAFVEGMKSDDTTMTACVSAAAAMPAFGD